MQGAGPGLGAEDPIGIQLGAEDQDFSEDPIGIQLSAEDQDFN